MLVTAAASGKRLPALPSVPPKPKRFDAGSGAEFSSADTMRH